LGVIPTLGGLIMLALFVKSCFDLKSSGATSIFGVGSPLAIGLGALCLGAVAMFLVRRCMPVFFQRDGVPVARALGPQEPASAVAHAPRTGDRKRKQQP